MNTVVNTFSHKCGTNHDRDLNASLNIKDEVIKIISSRTAELTLVESSLLEHSLKQEIQVTNFL